MPTISAARKKFENELATLVARFDNKREEYLRSDYNESQVRLQFIDPLFEALGWDVRDKRGKVARLRYSSRAVRRLAFLITRFASMA